MHPRLTARMEQTQPIPVLLWQFAEPRLCISSGPLGGGIGARDWVLNATVPIDYDRTDPDRHLTEIGTALKLVGTGCGLLTAVDVTRHHLAADSGVHATATVGLFQPGLGGRARPALPPRVAVRGPNNRVRRLPDRRVPTAHRWCRVPGGDDQHRGCGAGAAVSGGPRQRRGHRNGSESAGVIRDRGTGHRNRLGRDRRALPNGRHSGDLRRAALRNRRPDRTSGARGRTCRRPGLDFRAPRPLNPQTLVGADGIEPRAARRQPGGQGRDRTADLPLSRRNCGLHQCVSTGQTGLEVANRTGWST